MPVTTAAAERNGNGERTERQTDTQVTSPRESKHGLTTNRRTERTDERGQRGRAMVARLRGACPRGEAKDVKQKHYRFFWT